MKNTLLTLVLLISVTAFAWDSTGHRVIAQIAYQQLTPTARANIDQLTYEVDRKYPPLSRFLYASIWPDVIKGQSNQYNSWHFIEIPYSTDGTPTKPISHENVVWAILKSEKILQDPAASPREKAIFLRFLIHFVGDAHQPLHCINRFTHQYPYGDKNGLRFNIQDPYVNNLHSYWDEGVGLFRPWGKRYPLTNRETYKLAQKISRDYPEDYFTGKSQNLNPQDWSHESFETAKNFVYDTPENSPPSVKYNEEGQKIVEQQIALAGYRLANLLNRLFARSSRSR